MYKNTYNELASFIKCIESYSIANNELLKDVPIEIKYPINKITRVLLGLAFLGKTIEDGLLELENNIINVEYNKIIETVDKYMIETSEEEYNKLVDTQHNAFKNYKMDDKITNFFNKIL